MNRSRVPESWIDRLVLFMPLDEQGVSGPMLHGWLRGVQDDGILFAKGFHSDSHKRLMPEDAKFYPWSTVGLLEPDEHRH